MEDNFGEMKMLFPLMEVVSNFPRVEQDLGGVVVLKWVCGELESEKEENQKGVLDDCWLLSFFWGVEGL